MQSFSSLITQLGGPTVVAADLGLSRETVQKMKERDSIKPKRWPEFVRLAQKRGLDDVTIASLANIATAPKKKARG